MTPLDWVLIIFGGTLFVLAFRAAILFWRKP